MASDSLLPPLRSLSERAVVASYGGWVSFCAAFRLRPYNGDDTHTAVKIVQSLAGERARRGRANGKGKGEGDQEWRGEEEGESRFADNEKARKME